MDQEQARNTAVDPPDDERRQGLGLPADVHDVLLDVSRTAASCRDLRSLMRELAQVLRRIAHFDRVAIVLHDAASERCGCTRRRLPSRW